MKKANISIFSGVMPLRSFYISIQKNSKNRHREIVASKNEFERRK